VDKFSNFLEEIGFGSVDYIRLKNDHKELEHIADSIPKSNILSQESCLKLERYCIRGMNICDYWLPIIHIMISEQEIIRDQLKNKAYIDAKVDDGKLTLDLRKAIAEVDESYNNARLLVERGKSYKSFFQTKRETLKSSIFMLKDQLSSYKHSDKDSGGEELSYEVPKYGQVPWE
jgi:hypothetical protein